MTHSHIRISWLPAALVLTLAAAGHAQAPVPDIPSGTRIRVYTTGLSFAEVVGTYLETRDDTLFVQVPVWPRPVGVPLAAIQLIERSAGYSSRARQGVLIGAAAGAGAGIALTTQSSRLGDGNLSGNDLTDILIATGVGAGAGWVIGSLIRTERWEVMGNRSTVGISIAF